MTHTVKAKPVRKPRVAAQLLDVEELETSESDVYDDAPTSKKRKAISKLPAKKTRPSDQK